MAVKYDSWERECWLRTKQRAMLRDSAVNSDQGIPPLARMYPMASEPGLVFFPTSQAPYANRLEELHGTNAMRTAMVHCLYDYLRFTELLEIKSINHVGNKIALRELALPISDDLSSRAFLLVRDESHHAAVSNDVACQVRQLTDVPPLPTRRPQFLTRLGQLAERLGPDFVEPLEIAFATVSETLISGSLAVIPADPTVVPYIREFAHQHERDEARHHSYFTEFFAQWWPRLPVVWKQTIGPVLPDLCFAFLDPDYAAHQMILEAVGCSPRIAEELVRDAFPQAELRKSAKRSLRATMRLFERAGVFDDPRTAEKFAERGLA